ncbi:MAG: hypothetical protein JEZ07_08595 [Phycisphaerae bacterium]|nr:hypothetical protein [Phycisphaerae bacterium]
MKLLKIGNGKYINTERVTYIEAKKSDKVIVQFQTEVDCGGCGRPASFIELKGSEAEHFILWLDTNSEQSK